MSLTFTKRETPNYRLGRRGDFPIAMIVIHITEGLDESVYSWFGSARSQASSHYMVRKDGLIDQFVDEKDEAFHAGRILNPTAPLVIEREAADPESNPNWYSIGIEHEGLAGDDLTPAQRESSVALIRDICARRNIPMTRRFIVGHHEIFAGKSCPGKINVGTLVATAANPAIRLGVRVPAPVAVWSDYFRDWLIVTRVVSDEEWYFIPAKQLQSYKSIRAQTPLGAMPK